MAQIISDVMHASAVFDASRQELAWASSGDDFDVPEPMKGAVHTISEVLNEAEKRWLETRTSSGEGEPMAAVVDKENAMAVVATGHEEEKKRVVEEVDTRSIGEAERKIKRWLEHLEEVACDMRAVARKELLGDYSRIDDDKPSARWLACLPRTRRAARIAPTIDTVALKLEELKEQYDKEFRHSTGLPLAATWTEQPACISAAGGQEERETSVNGDVLVEENTIVPIFDDVLGDVKQRIIDIINGHVKENTRYNKNDTATIVPIFGRTCVGKTRLVMSVFHDEDTFAECFKAGLTMHKGWDMKEIHESIIEEIGREHFDGYFHNRTCYVHKVESEADYGHYIGEMLALYQKRLLLILDNLLEEQDLSMVDKLLGFLQNDAKRVSAIITTRSEDLARYIARRCNIAEYRLDPWSDDMCWEMIKQSSGLDLEATAAGTAVALSKMDGREIASNCSGRPLAADALGCFLQSVDPKEWPGLVRDIWNIEGGFSRALPTHSAIVFAHLKSVLGLEAESWLFLAYCAFVFPKGKGHGVVRCDLLSQWCSLGVTTLDRGVSCISELLGNSLLLREKNASAEAATLLTMEDLMHDFARYLLGDRLIVVDGKNGATPSMSSPLNNKSSSAYLALVRNFDAKQLDISSILPAGILALRFELCGEMELSDGAFESFGKYLRLLDLSGYSEKNMLPDFISHLKQLRYLKAPGIKDKELPRSITGLHELSYLILQRSCQLEDLTKAFQCLSNLLHLDLSGCSGLKTLPDSFRRLWRLEYLDLSECSGIEELPESFCWLPNLSHLDLSRCSGLKALPESFGGLNILRHLDLSRCSGLQDLPKSFEYLTELRHLDLSGLSRLQALPMVSLPRELQHLNLSGCSGLQEPLPDAPVPNELLHMDLSGCWSVSKLPASYSELKKLVHLNLSGCTSLIYLPKLTGPLEHLDMSFCTQLPYISIPFLPEMQYLDLSGCFGLRKGVEKEASSVTPMRIGGVTLNMRRTKRKTEQERINRLLEAIRSRGGSASGPEDASLRGLGTNHYYTNDL